MKTKKIIKNLGVKTAIFLAGAVCFATVTVFASWPDAPNGETVGGWLGKVFNLTESNADKLAVKSKTVVLPDDAGTITENKQVPTKEYVDGAVSASAGGAMGGSVFRLVQTQNAYNGNLGGYAGADAKCAMEYPGCKFFREQDRYTVASDVVSIPGYVGPAIYAGALIGSSGSSWDCDQFSSSTIDNGLSYSNDISLDSNNVLKVNTFLVTDCSAPLPLWCVCY